MRRFLTSKAFIYGLIAVMMLIFVQCSCETPTYCDDAICSEDESPGDCSEDCPLNCVDDGTISQYEDCSCKDVVCEEEDPASVCGSACSPEGECVNGMTCVDYSCTETNCRSVGDEVYCYTECTGTCWDEDICSALEPEAPTAPDAEPTPAT